MPHSHHLHTPHPDAPPTSGHGHNHAAGHSHPPATHNNAAPGQVAESHHSLSAEARGLTGSVLGWPAWQRVLVVLPVLLLLWLAVAWASREVQPW